MKKIILLFAASACVFTVCTSKKTSAAARKHSTPAATPAPAAAPAPAPAPSAIISLDSANKMLLSYLNSINYHVNDTDLRSVIFDASQLRNYLSNPMITNVKLMFAHTLDYINSGGKNNYAGYKSGALTLIVACYDANGNYVYDNAASYSTVLDYGMPCPSSCPTAGTAAVDTFQIVH